MLRPYKNSPQPNPARNYAQAADRIAALQARDGPEVNPASCTCWMTHGEKVERAALLLHGYTNSPAGFTQLGEQFYQRGWEVLIPREPHSGLLDRMTPAHAEITAESLVAFLDEAVDIVQGLGERVTVAGLSMGGLLAAWAAQHRADIDTAGIISPAFGFRALPRRLAPLAARLAMRLPNRFRWWDPRIKDTPHPPYHTYPRYSTRSLAQILRLSLLLQAQARRSPPLARSVIVITNPADETVDNDLAAQVVADWRAAGARNVRTYAFDGSYRLLHDLISPDQPEQQVELVYPILLELLT